MIAYISSSVSKPGQMLFDLLFNPQICQSLYTHLLLECLSSVKYTCHHPFLGARLQWAGFSYYQL